MSRSIVLIVLALCLATTVVVAKNTVSPFFNRHEEGIALDEASYGNIQKLKELRDRSVMQDLRRRGRRSLSVGSHPNLPGGGGVGGNNGAATDDGAAGGGAAGGGGPPPPVAGGGAVGGGEAPPPPVDGGASAAGGGGKGFLGKGKGSSTKDGGKGKGLHKKSSKKSGVGKGKGGKGSSGGGDGGDGVAPDDDFMIVDPPQPCMCTPDFCDCEGGLATDYEFVLVRDEIGSDTPGDGNFGVASGIGLNGHVYEMIYTTSGRDFGGDPIGMFKGFCTVVSDTKGELLCTYEIYIYANGDSGLGGVIVTGPVAGLETGREFESVVTGAEFDFSVFNTGFLTTVQDPQKPILYSFLSLYV